MRQEAQCSSLESCLAEISRLGHFTWYSTQSHYPDTGLTSSESLLYFLNAERQAKEQLVPFLKSLVWLGPESNPQSPDHKTDALPTI